MGGAAWQISTTQPRSFNGLSRRSRSCQSGISRPSKTYVQTLAPTQANPQSAFHATFLAMQSAMDAILGALARPPKLIGQIQAGETAGGAQLRLHEPLYAVATRPTRRR